VWEALQNRFEEKGLSRKIGLLQSHISTRYEGKMGDFLSKIVGWQAATILAGLSDNFRPFIMGLEASGVKIATVVIISLMH
jgi:hypothetical protein